MEYSALTEIVYRQPDEIIPEDGFPVEPSNALAGTATEGSRNLNQLFEEHADCYAWLCIPNTEIDYPVMHTPNDPQKYLRRNFYGDYSVSGVPFLDGRCSEDSENLILYGHNMDDGTMFAQLTRYLDADFFSDHQTVELETRDGCSIYRVIAVAKIRTDDPWYAYTEPVSANTRVSLLKELFDNSVVHGEMPHEGQLLTMSTCYGFRQDGRLVVVAVRI